MNLNLRLSELQPEAAVANWFGVLAPYLKPAVENGPQVVTLNDLYQELLGGFAKILIIWDPESKATSAVLYVEADEYPQCRALRISYCGGSDMAEWIHLYPTLRAWARGQGFTKILITGRPGWKRMLKDYLESYATQYVDDLERDDG